MVAGGEASASGQETAHRRPFPMNAICGFHLREARAADGLSAMLAALSDYGKTGAQWREGAAGLGCRYTTATNGDGAGRTPCLDRAEAPRPAHASGSTRSLMRGSRGIVRDKGMMDW